MDLKFAFTRREVTTPKRAPFSKWEYGKWEYGLEVATLVASYGSLTTIKGCRLLCLLECDYERYLQSALPEEEAQKELAVGMAHSVSCVYTSVAARPDARGRSSVVSTLSRLNIRVWATDYVAADYEVAVAAISKELPADTYAGRILSGFLLTDISRFMRRSQTQESLNTLFWELTCSFSAVCTLDLDACKKAAIRLMTSVTARVPDSLAQGSLDCDYMALCCEYILAVKEQTYNHTCRLLRLLGYAAPRT